MNAQVVLEFIRAINAADVEKMCSLMTEHHVFTDSQNNKVIGRDAMKQAWIEYYKLFPDYHIEVNDVLEKHDIIVVTGYAGATYKNLRHEDKDNSWIVPACFKAIVADGKIELWQVFADMTKAYEIVKRFAKVEPEIDLPDDL